jgi:hypothetical protein
MGRSRDVCHYQTVVEVLHTVESYSTTHGGVDTYATFFPDLGLAVVLIDGGEKHKLGFPILAVSIFSQLSESFAFSELIHDMQSIIKVGSSTNVTSTIVLSSQSSGDNVRSRRVIVFPSVSRFQLSPAI